MADELQELPAGTWRAYFDDLSRDIPVIEATIEIEGRDLGAQVQAENLVLNGITYDDRDDVLVIGLDAPSTGREEFEHFIYQPKQIFVDTAEGVRPTTIEVQDGQGDKTLIQLSEVEALPDD